MQLGRGLPLCCVSTCARVSVHLAAGASATASPIRTPSAKGPYNRKRELSGGTPEQSEPGPGTYSQDRMVLDAPEVRAPEQELETPNRLSLPPIGVADPVFSTGAGCCS